MPRYEELLEVLSCEIAARPAGAPTPDDLARAVRAVRRQAGTLTIDFQLDARPAVAALVDAERQCCATMGWELTDAPDRVTLSISGSPAQLDAISTLWPKSG